MTSFSLCRNKGCAARVDGTVRLCPSCGGRMMTSSSVRVTGWVMTIVGALIALPTAVLVLKFLPVVSDPQAAVAAGRFGGAADQVPMAMALLLSMLAFGGSLLGFGMPRALRARRHPLTKPVVLGLGLLFLALMFYFGSQLPDQPPL
jgi:multisubunit Na+/H+ antiporter MnhG subunit